MALSKNYGQDSNSDVRVFEMVSIMKLVQAEIIDLRDHGFTIDLALPEFVLTIWIVALILVVESCGRRSNFFDLFEFLRRETGGKHPVISGTASGVEFIIKMADMTNSYVDIHGPRFIGT
nr:hypothetical protein [Agrobacterium sp.]